MLQVHEVQPLSSKALTDGFFTKNLHDGTKLVPEERLFARITERDSPPSTSSITFSSRPQNSTGVHQSSAPASSFPASSSNLPPTSNDGGSISFPPSSGHPSEGAPSSSAAGGGATTHEVTIVTKTAYSSSANNGATGHPKHNGGAKHTGPNQTGNPNFDTGKLRV